MVRRSKPQPQPLYYLGEGIATIPVYANKRLPVYQGSNTHEARQQLIDISLYVLLRARDAAKSKTSGHLKKQLFSNMRINAKTLAKEVVKRIGQRRSPRKMEDICRAALRLYALSNDDSVRANYSVHSPYTLDFQEKNSQR